MRDRQDLSGKYDHILGDHPDPGLLRVIADLDAMIAHEQPPPHLAAAIQRARGEQADLPGTPPQGVLHGSNERGLTTVDTPWSPMVSSFRRTLSLAGAGVFLLLVGVAVLGLSTLLSRMEGGAGRGLAYAVVQKRDSNATTEVVAFDADTGQVIRRIPTGYQTEVLPTPDGKRLYLLQSRLSPDYKSMTHFLSVVDTRSWETLGSTTVQDRMLYTGEGPPSMALSPDGSRLFMASYKVLGQGTADYWLTVVDTRSMHVLPTRIPMPKCGVAIMATAKDWVLAQCVQEDALHFIDPKTLKDVGQVAMPGDAQGLAVAPDHEKVYVVTLTPDIVEVDTSTRTLTRQVQGWPQVENVYGLSELAVTSDGRHLVLGSLAERSNVEPQFALAIYDLPSMRFVRKAPLSRYDDIASAPHGGLYLFPMLEADDKDLSVRLLSPDFTRITPLLRLDGRLIQFVP